MEQRAKRFKITKESAVTDIAASVDDIATTTKSISKSYGEILGINKMVISYLQDAEKRDKEISLKQTMTDLERTSIRENQ